MACEGSCRTGTIAPRSSNPSASTSASPPSAASRGASDAAVSSGPIPRARWSRMSPVSSPSSICMMVTPVSWSPDAMAHWMGAAPRYRGRSEPCTLIAP